MSLEPDCFEEFMVGGTRPGVFTVDLLSCGRPSKSEGPTFLRQGFGERVEQLTRELLSTHSH